MSPRVEDADVVVVGAGLAGLVTASGLAERGHHVLVLEAGARVGGRTDSRPAHGLTLDQGGTYIGRLHTEVAALADRLGLPRVRTAAAGASLFDFGGRLLRDDGPTPPYSALALGLALDRVEELAERVDLDEPGRSPDAETQDRTTVRDWLAEEFDHPDSRLLIEQIVREMLAAEPDEVSLLHFLFYVRSGGGLPFLTAFASGAQEERFAGGARALSDGLAAGLGGAVRLSTPVRGISARPDGTIRVAADGLLVDCSQVVLATGPGPEAAIAFDGVDATGSAPVPVAGTAVKLHLVYPEPFWQREGLSGWVTADRAPLRFLVDDSAGRGGLGVLVGFLTGAEARLWHRGESSAESVLARLAEWLGPQVREPLGLYARDWQREPLVQGCYAAVPALGDWVRRARAAAPDRRWPRVHRVGAEYSPHFFGHLEGAVRSAHAVAAAIHRAELVPSGCAR
ncbi:flavin monoamine oxidase family protein [Kitasatospora sp. NPDC018058]|uniref:flavin monoamine oxidase family protein n=1 Tax=Kitasatospora sp. NPDC018058 TaxID=3364025 RepID=UPI0037C09236